MCKMFPLVYNSAKIIKNPSRFSRVMVTNVLPPFYGSRCRTVTVSSRNVYVVCVLF